MRFRLKTEYMQYVRDQIRGGLWFAPSWWSAISKVPPAHFQPAIAKRKVPKITFAEDKLKRDFHAKNPTIAAFDGGKRGGATVAAAFVERQLESMRVGGSKQQAYDVALAWMLENGPAMAARLDLPKDARAVLELRPEDVPAARAAAKVEMERELEHVRRVLASTEEEETEAEGQGGVVVDRAGLFLSPQLQLGIGLRGLSAEAAVDSRIVDATELAGHSSAGTAAAKVQVDVLESKGSQAEAVSRVLAGGGAAAPKPTKKR